MRLEAATAGFAAVFSYLQRHELIVVDDSIMIAAAFLALLGFVAMFGLRSK